MFGQSYDESVLLKEAKLGLHEVFVRDVDLVKDGDKEFIVLAFLYEGGEKLLPEYTRIYDLKPPFTPEQQRAFTYRLKQLRKAFSFEGEFTKEGMNLGLKGKKGYVYIARDKQGYAVVNRFVPRDEIEEQKPIF